jgi:hypothetical protein
MSGRIEAARDVLHGPEETSDFPWRDAYGLDDRYHPANAVVGGFHEHQGQ